MEPEFWILVAVIVVGIAILWWRDRLEHGQYGETWGQDPLKYGFHGRKWKR